MLPLLDYTSKVSFALLTSILILASCTDNSEKNIEIIRALDESLSNSNKMLAASTEDLLTSLRDKLSDPATAEKAQVWYPKAQMVQKLSSQVYNSIEKIKTELLNEKANSKYNGKIFFRKKESLIYDSLMNYKRKVLDIDSKIDYVFKSSLVAFTPSFDSIDKANSNLIETFFENADIDAAMAMLTRVQNNIRLNENRVIAFCREDCVSMICGFGSCFSTLIGLDRGVVEPGGAIELVAGIGEFNRHTKPEIFVYGNQVALDASALAVYKFKAENRPGKYYVPVKINFTNQDGIQQTIMKDIQYTVAVIVKKEK